MKMLQGRRRRFVGWLVAMTVICSGLAWRQFSGTAIVAQRAPETFRVTNGIVTLEKDAPQWAYLTFATAKEQSALPPLPAPARVTVDERKEEAIHSQLPGRVEQVAVQLGDTVKAGTALVAIRSTSLPDLKRDTAKHKASGLRQLDGSGLFWIRADAPGTVVERRALMGMEVGPQKDEPLVLLAELDKVIVVADLVDSEAQLVSLGSLATVKITGNSTEAFVGAVEYVGRTVDPLRHTIPVRIRVDNKEGKLRPNSFAQVTFPPAPYQVMVVPGEAVVTDGDRSVVFVKESRAGHSTVIHKRVVTRGRSREGKVEVISGLQAGEDYVSRGAFLILNAIHLAE